MRLADDQRDDAPTDEPTRYQAIRRSTRPMLAAPDRAGHDPSERRVDVSSTGLTESTETRRRVDANVDPAADGVTDEPALQVRDARDRVAIQLDHDIADARPAAAARTRIQDLDDLEAALPTAVASRGPGRAAGCRRRCRGTPAHPTVDDQRIEDPPRRRVDRARPGRGRSRRSRC